MTPIKTDLCNFAYTAPAGMTEDQCGTLHCMRDPENRTVTSFWKPEPEESARIAAGGLVMLTVCGLAHPPVAIGAFFYSSGDTPPTRPPLLTHEEIFQALGKLMERIEDCGASPELTAAVMLAEDIRCSIGNQWNPANEYAAQRVREIIQPTDS